MMLMLRKAVCAHLGTWFLFESLQSDPFLLSGLDNLCVAREHALQLRVKSEEVFKGIKDAICLHADVRNSIDTTAGGGWTIEHARVFVVVRSESRVCTTNNYLSA